MVKGVKGFKTRLSVGLPLTGVLSFGDEYNIKLARRKGEEDLVGLNHNITPSRLPGGLLEIRCSILVYL
jgi:hypothetical protein